MKERREKNKMNEIATLISTVGFPIAACIGMGWFVKYQTDNNNKTMSDLRAEQAEQNNTMLKAINNNTKALQELIDKLDLCKAVENDK